jgi:hypothetical protein
MDTTQRKSSSRNPDKVIVVLGALDPETLSEQIRKLMIAQRMGIGQVAKWAKMKSERLEELMGIRPMQTNATPLELRKLARALNTKPKRLVSPKTRRQRE